MNHLSFLLARTLRREAPLRAASITPEMLLARFAGQNIALIGNARGLANSTHGAEIDLAQTVIRINRAPMPSPVSHGTRTDVLALATSLDEKALTALNPGYTLWMSPKRKRLPWHVVNRPGFYLHPIAAYTTLRRKLKAPPTTGLMLIDMLARSEASHVSLYGFDFFATQSLSGRRRADQTPHDFAAEAAFVRNIIATDARFSLKHHPA